MFLYPTEALYWRETEKQLETINMSISEQGTKGNVVVEYIFDEYLPGIQLMTDDDLMPYIKYS